MNSTADAVFRSWNFDPWLLFSTLAIALLYSRGWVRLHRRAPHRLGATRLIAFVAGLAVILIALISPLDAFAGWLLTVHMIQHLLLMMVAPPLILYGAPYMPLLFGLPNNFLRDGVGPFLTSRLLRKIGHFAANPIFCWSAFVFTNIAWHAPRMYELALRSPTWHQAEHLCFLTTALLFWLPVIQPWPSTKRSPRWSIIIYLFLADFQNTALSAFLIFYERVLYPTYEAIPRISAMTALEDQAAAGAIMWVAGSLFFLVPVGLITIEVMNSRRVLHVSKRSFEVSRLSKRPKTQPTLRLTRGRYRLDLFSVPLLGSVLRWRHLRRSAQLLTFLLALLVVLDGLFGPQIAPMNLAGVLPWTHWRGLTVIVLLIAGNIFCFACPFNFARELGRRILPARWSWPRRLRSKWIAIALLLIFFWAYEAFSLWDSPSATSMMVMGYFAAAITVDGFFKGASFCKYVCPIGQYQFVQSLISPVEVGVRSLAVCSSCQTHDCLRGNEKQRGCELQLFLPRKESNMDCTFCLDCVQACPQNNVSLLASLPGTQLVQIQSSHKRRNRFFRRFDVAVLILLLVFAAFINAGGMVLPVQGWERSMQAKFGIGSIQPILAVIYLFSLGIIPVLLIAGCVWFSTVFGRMRRGWKETTTTFAPAFIPVGFSMWLIHFSYHLVNSTQAAVPVIQRAAADAGIKILGTPEWSLSSMMPSFDWLPSLELLLLDLGLLFSLFIGWRIAARFRMNFVQTLRLNAPWSALAVALYAIGVWIIFQPMQMRGMMIHAMH